MKMSKTSVVLNFLFSSIGGPTYGPLNCVYAVVILWENISRFYKYFDIVDTLDT